MKPSRIDNTISPPLLIRLPLPSSITTFRREVVSYAFEAPGPLTGLGKKGRNIPILLGKIKYAKRKYPARNTMSSGSMKRAYDKIFNDDGDTSGIFAETPVAKSATLTTLSHDETPMEPMGLTEIIAPPTPAALVVNNPPIRKGILPLSTDDAKWKLTLNISNRDLDHSKVEPMNELSSEQTIKWVNSMLSKELLDTSTDSLIFCINKTK